MTAGRLEAMKKAIVGLVMTVEEVEGSFKLNQHKSDADHVAIARRWPRKPMNAATGDREHRWSRCGRSWITISPDATHPRLERNAP